MTEKKSKSLFKFQTEIVNGVCGACNLHTLMVGIDNKFYMCISGGEDLEQKVNCVIKYIKVDKHTDLTAHGEEVSRSFRTRGCFSQDFDWTLSK